MLSSRPRRAFLAWLAAFLLVAAAVPVGAAGPPGNNGTVKIHEGAFASGDADPVTANDPHVGCPFHVHFMFADTQQSGDWWIVGHAPTKDNAGINGSYDTGASTSAVAEDLQLASGHYKLYWQGRNDKNVQHKTFWVDGECGGEGGEEGGEEPPGG